MSLQREKSQVSATNPFVSAGVSSAPASAQSTKSVDGPSAPTPVRRNTGRSCQFSYDIITMVIRILSAITSLGAGVSGGWAVYQAHLLYKSDKPAAACTQAVNFEQFSMFLGIIGCYYGVLGSLGFLAEVRHHTLRKTVLKPFGFLLMWIGRGVYYILLGALLVELPIDSDLGVNSPQRYVAAQVPASMLLICGTMQILVSIFVRKERGVVRPNLPQSTSIRSQSSKGPGASVNWGGAEPEKEEVDVEMATADPAPAPSTPASLAPTPSKVRLLPSKSVNATTASNPFQKT